MGNLCLESNCIYYKSEYADRNAEVCDDCRRRIGIHDGFRKRLCQYCGREDFTVDEVVEDNAHHLYCSEVCHLKAIEAHKQAQRVFEKLTKKVEEL
jgi:hypothetical protein